MSEYRVERDSISKARNPRAGLRWRGDSNRCSKLFHFGMPPLPAALIKVDIQANVDACDAEVQESLSMATSLNPLIGYKKAALLLKEPRSTRQDHRSTVPGKKDFYQKQRCRKRSNL